MGARTLIQRNIGGLGCGNATPNVSQRVTPATMGEGVRLIMPNVIAQKSYGTVVALALASATFLWRHAAARDQHFSETQDFYGDEYERSVTEERDGDFVENE